MGYKYAASTNGLYHTDVHQTVPDDAIDLTDAEYADIYAALDRGAQLRASGASYTVVEPPELDVAAIRESEKRLAYAQESDPLFFKWQRGESTQQEWLDKINEIKARFQ